MQFHIFQCASDLAKFWAPGCCWVRPSLAWRASYQPNHMGSSRGVHKFQEGFNGFQWVQMSLWVWIGWISFKFIKFQRIQRSMDSDIFDAMFLPFGHLSDLSKHRRNSFKRSRCTSKTWPSSGAQSAPRRPNNPLKVVHSHSWTLACFFLKHMFLFIL